MITTIPDWSVKLQCSLEEYLLSHRRIDPITECWEFTLKKRSGEYGAFTWNSKGVTVHRAAYQVWVGPLLSELMVCHSCDNKICFNPDHLFQGTSLDNVQDMIKKGRRPSNGDAIKRLWRQGTYEAQLNGRGDRNSSYMKQAWSEGKFDHCKLTSERARILRAKQLVVRK